MSETATKRMRAEITPVIVGVDPTINGKNRFIIPSGYRLETKSGTRLVNKVSTRINFLSVVALEAPKLSAEAKKPRKIGFIHRAITEGGTEDRLYCLENIFAQFEVLNGEINEEGYYVLSREVPKEAPEEVTEEEPPEVN